MHSAFRLSAVTLALLVSAICHSHIVSSYTPHVKKAYICFLLESQKKTRVSITLPSFLLSSRFILLAGYILIVPLTKSMTIKVIKGISQKIIRIVSHRAALSRLLLVLRGGEFTG